MNPIFCIHKYIVDDIYYPLQYKYFPFNLLLVTYHNRHIMIQNPHRPKWTGIDDIPSAPLIGEQLTAIDFDFMRIKATLKNEFPLMSLTELAEYNYYITPFTSTYL